MNYDGIIVELVTRNGVQAIHLLYYDSITSITSNAWEDPQEFMRQIQIQTTSFPSSAGSLSRLNIVQPFSFNIRDFLQEGDTLGLHSSLVYEGRTLYWVMLDFIATHTEENLRRMELYLETLFTIQENWSGGYIVETDRSYHFIGKEPVRAESLRVLLWNVLKSNGRGLVDLGFCAHALAKNLDICLRIQPRKDGCSLEVVRELC